MINQYIEKEISEPLNLAIIGLGRMGKNHLKTVANEKGINLVSLYDVVNFEDLNLNIDYKSKYTKSFDLIKEYANKGIINSAIISCPTQLHYEFASELLRNGIHCLIEKPACTSVDDVESLIEIAEENGAKIAVGHAERFNSAFISLLNTLRAHRWDKIKVSRLNPTSIRLRTDSIISDLMVHDIDLIANQLNLPPKGSMSACATSFDNLNPEHVSVKYSTEHKTEIEICCGRLPGPQVREIEAEGKDGSLHIDLLRKNFVFKPKRSGICTVTGLSTDNSYSDALSLQLKEFIHMINGDNELSITSIYDARRSLVLCQEVEKSALAFILKDQKEFA